MTLLGVAPSGLDPSGSQTRDISTNAALLLLATTLYIQDEGSMQIRTALEAKSQSTRIDSIKHLGI